MIGRQKRKVPEEHVLYPPQGCDTEVPTLLRKFGGRGLPAYHNCRIVNDVPVVIMEHIHGETLTDLVAERRVDRNTAIHVVSQVADILVRFHRYGCSHLDLSPNNILTTPDGMAYLIDLGALSPEREHLGGTIGDLGGTPEFVGAPGDLKFAAIDVLSRDWYSLGRILDYLRTRLPEHTTVEQPYVNSCEFRPSDDLDSRLNVAIRNCTNRNSLLRLTSCARSLSGTLRQMLGLEEKSTGFPPDAKRLFFTWVCATLERNIHYAISWLKRYLAGLSREQATSTSFIVGASGKLSEQIENVEPFLDEIFDAVPAFESTRSELKQVKEDLLETLAVASPSLDNLSRPEQEKVARRLVRQMGYLRRVLREFVFFQGPKAKALRELIAVQFLVDGRHKSDVDQMVRLLQTASVPDVLWRGPLASLQESQSAKARNDATGLIDYRIQRHLIYGSAGVLSPVGEQDD